MSDDESIHSESEQQSQRHHVVGDMDMDLGDNSAPVVSPASQIQTGANQAHATNDGEDDDEEQNEELQRQIRRKLAEKRKGKRPEQSPQQKADVKAARRRARRLARAEEEEEAYLNAYRPILTIKSSQGFVWNQV
jgi:hypothetical protein